MKKHPTTGSCSRQDSGRSRNNHNRSHSHKNNSAAAAGINNNSRNRSAPNSGINIECASSEQGFTPQQQKAIIQHLLITKNSAPKKDYSHVPCKFFVQGNCQAGDSCPFSHDLNNSTSEQVCKYFQKGNCKFGMKCANAHISSNGTRVNPRRSSLPNSSSGKNNFTLTTRVPDVISNVNYRNQLAAEQQAHQQQSSLQPQYSTPLSNPVSSFMWTPENTSPIAYNNYTVTNTVPMSEPNFNSAELSVPSMFAYHYENPSSSQSSHFSRRNQEFPVADGYSMHELQLEETLLPNELSDLLTPNEFKRRESFKMSMMGNKPLSASNSSSSMSTEPRLSYSSSSSASDNAWRSLSSSNLNQNLDYWRNLGQVENNLNRFKLDEQDEDQFNDYRILHGPTVPQIKLTANGNNISVHEPNDSNDTQFSFDDLHGGIY